MCGICGVLRTDDSPIDTDNLADLKSIASLMSSRGPDSEGRWANDHCAMEFRRLAILDLSSAGDQPLTTRDGRYVLVMNGEIYNFREIRDSLVGRGAKIRSSGDAEVVLHALATYGTKALEQFNGMFALAFYDTHEKSLLLARDHAGIKPLYFHRSDKGILFASQYDQITSHPWTRRSSICAHATALYLRFGYIPAPFSALEGSEILEPGSWKLFDSSGRCSTGRFFEFPKFTLPKYRGRDAIEAVNSAVDSAVERHMISDVPIGVFLSGGIDSPLVSAKAQMLSDEPLVAFSIGVNDSLLDETSDAKNFAREFGLSHCIEYITEDQALGYFDDVVRACSEPTADYSIFPTYLVSKIASDHVKVVLSGDGGDEPFFGYPSRMGSPIRLAEYFAQSTVRRLLSIMNRKLLRKGAATKEILSPSIGALCLKKQSIPQPQFLERVFPDLAALPRPFEQFEFQSTDQAEVAQYVRWLEFYVHLPRVLLKVDRASMAHSLEVRVPLLDKEVLGVALQVEWDSCLYLDDNMGKIPLRECLKQHIGYQSRTKRGFSVPIDRWLTSSLSERFLDTVSSAGEFAGMPVNKTALWKYFEQLRAGRKDIAWSLWLIFMLVEWQNAHLASR